MKASIHSTGIRLEPRIDNVVEWSYPIEGQLEIYEKGAKFGDWIISSDQVSEAVLNSERFLFKKHQTLLIEGNGEKYVFGFFNPVESDIVFPFDVRVIERRSFIGKLTLFAFAMFFLSIVWQLIKLIVGV